MSQDTQSKRHDRNRSIQASEWIGHGTGLLQRRDALPATHPESWPSLWIKKYGSLDGFPKTNGVDMNGAAMANKETYYVCRHCDCVNVVAQDGMISF